MKTYRVGVMALVASALALSSMSAPAYAQQDGDAAAAPGAAGPPGGRGDPNDPANRFRRAAAAILAERLPRERVALVKIDGDIFTATQKKNLELLDEKLDVEVKFLNGSAVGARQWLDRDGLIAKVKAGPVGSAKLVEQTLKGIFGVESDVAVVTGFIQKPAEANPSEAYTAVYAQLHDEWQLVDYAVTPLAAPRPPAANAKPASVVKPWSMDDLSTTQARVVTTLGSFLDAGAKGDKAKLEQVLGVTFWYVNGPAVQKTKASFIAGPASPDVTIENPEVTFPGNYGDVAIVTGVLKPKAGAAGGESHFMAVVRRRDLVSDVWLVDHIQATPVRR